MKFCGQDKYGPLVVRHLQTMGPHTVRETANAIGVPVGETNKALHRMVGRGLVEGTGEYRGDGKFRAQVFRWADVEDEEILEPVMNDYERNRALEATDRVIKNLRAIYNPRKFDPFRVLRAQVGGSA